MREILFKAKRESTGEWVEGFYAKRHGVPYIYENADCPQSIYEINPDTLCQYTGLTDKNGRKIWENDIVRWIDKLYKVSFYDSMCSFVLVTSTGHWNHMEMNYGNKLECFDYEVVGNVFDNPDLLKATTETIGYADQSGLMSAT